MEKILKLSDEDCDFFGLVSRAAFCHPFGEERVDLDLKISECPADTPHDKRIKRIIGRVQEKVLRLAGKEPAILAPDPL